MSVTMVRTPKSQLEGLLSLSVPASPRAFSWWPGRKSRPAPALIAGALLPADLRVLSPRALAPLSLGLRCLSRQLAQSQLRGPLPSRPLESCSAGVFLSGFLGRDSSDCVSCSHPKHGSVTPKPALCGFVASGAQGLGACSPARQRTAPPVFPSACPALVRVCVHFLRNSYHSLMNHIRLGGECYLGSCFPDR